MAVVKGNGYGHGLKEIVQILDSYVDAFAVATLEEATELRSTGCKKPVNLLSGFFSENQLATLDQLQVDVTVFCEEQIKILEFAKLPKKLGVWLKFNTGMNRLGFPLDQVSIRINRIRKCNFAKLKGLMSHFAVADELDSDFTSHQIEQFLENTKDYGVDLSLANSAGILRWPKSRLHWVRAGIMLYGVSPFESICAKQLNLKPAMNLNSIVIAVNQLNAGEAIGYGLTWSSPTPIRFGIVACGYADGYFRSASPGAKVLIGNREAKLIGRVSMDSIAIDLSKHPEVRVGSRVKLFGDGLPVESIAKAAGTIPYEVLTSVGTRVVNKRYF